MRSSVSFGRYPVREHVQAFAQWSLRYGTPDIVYHNAGVSLPEISMMSRKGNWKRWCKRTCSAPITWPRAPALVWCCAATFHCEYLFHSSLHALRGGWGYSISGLPLHGLTRTCAMKWKKHGIRVIGVYPGAVMTDSWGGFDNSSGRIVEASDGPAWFPRPRLSVQAGFLWKISSCARS